MVFINTVFLSIKICNNKYQPNLIVLEKILLDKK